MVKPSEPAFLNVEKVVPGVIVDLRYATTNNFTQQVVYNFNQAIARAGTVRKLAKAAELLQPQGYRLKIWDAYRPTTAQERLFEVYPHEEWVAKPNPNFSHQKGVTFDLTLTDADGHELLMPTKFDDFTGTARRATKWPAEPTKNYQILDQAMTQAGFVGYVGEWWDYRDTDADQYGPMQVDPRDY